ncbi:MAG: hypothetical protein LLG00_17235 [Planctomycetaceae bacterium]|nr:hypothetical protein [Planctomycetaceae bacterium]
MNRNMTLVALSAVVIVAGLPNRLLGQVCGDPCGSCCQPVTCKVLTPQMVTEYRTKAITSYRPETRVRMVTVYRSVPVKDTVEEEYTVMVPETRMRTVVDTIDRPVYGDLQLRKTTMTPQVQARQAKQTVTRLVAVQEERTVYDTTGCCPTSVSASPVAAPPSPAQDMDPNAPPAPREKPRPDTVAVGGACNLGCNVCPRKVCVTCWKPVQEQQTVQYAVTNFQPDAKLSTVAYYEYQPETKLRSESYVVQTPEIRTRTREITVTRTVAEQQPEQYTVMVPRQEHIRVPVLVCRYVERTVVVR